MIDKILEQRGSNYGEFSDHAIVTKAMKDLFRGEVGFNGQLIATNWKSLTPSQQESLDMIAHKIGRIINIGSNPNYADSWIDIGGYSQLIVNELNKKENE